MISEDRLVTIAQALAAGPGTFVEAGANDGLRQSNSLPLERILGWRGVLIEPSPAAFAELSRNRPANHLIQAALVSFERSGTPVRGAFRDGLLTGTIDASLYSRAPDVVQGPMDSLLHRFFAALRLDRPPTLVTVQTSTLSEILDSSEFSRVDFLSLDVEGFELQALDGIDFGRHAPRVIVIEARKRDLWDIVQKLTLHGYVLAENLSRFAETARETWSGDHEDLLFVKREELARNSKLREVLFEGSK